MPALWWTGSPPTHPLTSGSLMRTIRCVQECITTQTRMHICIYSSKSHSWKPVVVWYKQVVGICLNIHEAKLFFLVFALLKDVNRKSLNIVILDCCWLMWLYNPIRDWSRTACIMHTFISIHLSIFMAAYCTLKVYRSSLKSKVHSVQKKVNVWLSGCTARELIISCFAVKCWWCVFVCACAGVLILNNLRVGY